MKALKRRLGGPFDPKWWKYRLIRRLDRRPDTCWAQLVMWVEYGNRPLSECRIDGVCRKDMEDNGSCLCGKVRAAGAPREVAR